VKFKKLEKTTDRLVFKPAKEMNDTHFWWDKSMDEKKIKLRSEMKVKEVLETTKILPSKYCCKSLKLLLELRKFSSYIF
jgi:hypothetical protein